MGKYINREDIEKGVRQGIINIDKAKDLLLAGDPVNWAETYLRNPDDPSKPVSLWNHQVELLRCQSRNIAARIGRQSGKTITLICKMIWEIYTESNIFVLVLCPRKENVNTLWDKMNAMIQGTVVERSITRKKGGGDDDKYELILNNKSRIKAFAVNQYPEQIRGMSPNKIFLDEADYIADPALKAMTGFIISHPDVTIWASSTPTGARGWFYKICNSSLYSEFHYPTPKVNPNWGPEMEEQIRESIKTDMEYVHEVLAEWGDIEQGVFKSKAIDQCILRGEPGPQPWKYMQKTHHLYRMKDLDLPREGSKYIVGVDWNGRHAGVQILVMEIGYFDGKVRLTIVDRISVSDMEATQTKAIQTIISIYKKYKPVTVAVDEGFGHTQIEMLKLWAKQHPQYGIGEALRPIRWGDTIAVVDPFTHIPRQKMIRYFMIDNAVRIVEDSILVLPAEEDDERTQGLVWQMRNFRIKDYTTEGKPIYSKGNDHILSCLLMILYIYAIDYTNLLNMGGYRNIGIVGTTRNPVLPTGKENPIVKRLTVRDGKESSPFIGDGSARDNYADSTYRAAAISAGLEPKPFDDDENLFYSKKLEQKKAARQEYGMVRIGGRFNRRNKIVRRRI